MAMVLGSLEGRAAERGPAVGKAPATVDLQGTIRVSGAWALYPMMVKWAEEFRKLHPKVRIDVSAGGAGKGAADTLTGMVDIGMVSREIRQEETRQGLFGVPVVKDAVFPTINGNNPVLATLMKKGIKKSVFTDLWIMGKPLTWGSVAGQAVPTRIQVYTRSDSCGAAETWAKYLGKKQEDLKGVAVYGDPGVAEAIRRDPAGIGYNNLNYAYDMRTGRPVAGLQIAPIDVNENGRVDPGERLMSKHDAIQAVLAGRYPSPPARDLYLVAKGNFKGTSLAFVRWILTDGQRYAEEVGYLKVTPGQVKESLKKVR
ncbi:MAG: phosphate ABC transporter substrate-binding protein [Syntrophaceae bacterium]|nr:phosphate ABC transporter substrate-binding protein [Syntrophaceae bacterium]